MHEITSIPLTPVGLDGVAQVRGYEKIRAGYPGYLTDESKLTGGPFDYLFFPRDEAELASVVKAMVSDNIPITVAGARTGLAGGCVPKSGAMISLEKMDRMLELYLAGHADEWRVRLQPGVQLAELHHAAMSGCFPDLENSADPEIRSALDRFAAEPGKFCYPPDPTETSASVGGTVATNASGARTFRYGSTRDWVRGIRVMTLTGEILDIPRGKYFSSPSGQFTILDSTGGYTTVRIPDYTMPRTKNTAGFYAAPHMDLIDLFIGSEGAFGIITAIDVGLLPWRPKCSIVQFTDSSEQAIQLISALRSDKRLQLDFLEFYSDSALDLLRSLQTEDPCRVGMPPIPEAAGGAVFFELDFDPEEKSPDYSALEKVVGGVGATLKNSWAAYEAWDLARFKAFRHLLPETVTAVVAKRKKNHPGLHRLSSDFAVPDAHLEDIWSFYKQRLSDSGIQWVGYGHVGNNHFHIASLPRDMVELENGMAIYADFARQAVAYGGTVSAEHGIGKIKTKFLKIMYSEEQLEQMRTVKRAFDPDGLLNPGNIFNNG